MDSGQAIGLRLARQDGSALEDAYAVYADSVLSYLTRFVGHSEAEDVLQRTFLDAWRFAERYDPHQRFAGWLFTIAHHRAVDALRARRPDTVAIELADDLVGDDGRVRAARLVEAAEVRSAIAQLPGHERQVIELTYFGGLTQKETAEHLDVPIGTVKARGSRAMKRLGVLLRAMRDAPSG